MRRSVNILFIGITVAVLSGGGYFYWHYQQQHPSTSDAYIQANVVRIAAQVAGPVTQLYVTNQEFVKKGALLFEIDPAPYQIALDKAQAQLELAQQGNSATHAAISAAQAQLHERRIELDDQQRRTARITTLVKKGVMPQQQGDDAIAALKTAEAAVTAATAELNREKNSIHGNDGHDGAIREAMATLAKARLDLDHTQVTAPEDGKIANLTLRKGTMVAAGAPLFALVEAGEWWVEANFKETDLASIRTGQPASVNLDMYPDINFNGEVQSISPASGVAFSLLPPENATGNWVKITQRFPVKVLIKGPDPAYPLLLGASSQVTIDASATTAR